MRMVSASWNSLRWLLTTNYFTSTGTDMKVALKFATILFSHFLSTKVILAQCVELLILVQTIVWDVMFETNGFTNAVLRYSSVFLTIYRFSMTLLLWQSFQLVFPHLFHCNLFVTFWIFCISFSLFWVLFWAAQSLRRTIKIWDFSTFQIFIAKVV